MGLKIKPDFSGTMMELEDADHMVEIIDLKSELIQSEFDKWNKVERRIFKTHFNELI